MYIFRPSNCFKILQLCDQSEIETNIRFKLLQLRDRKEPEFVGMVIPNRLKEIPTNIFSQYKQRVEEQQNLTFLEEHDNSEDELILKRSQGKKRLMQIYTLIFQKCLMAKSNLEYEDIMNEKIIPQIEYVKLFKHIHILV